MLIIECPIEIFCKRRHLYFCC